MYCKLWRLAVSVQLCARDHVFIDQLNYFIINLCEKNTLLGRQFLKETAVWKSLYKIFALKKSTQKILIKMWCELYTVLLNSYIKKKDKSLASFRVAGIFLGWSFIRVMHGHTFTSLRVQINLHLDVTALLLNATYDHSKIPEKQIIERVVFVLYRRRFLRIYKINTYWTHLNFFFIANLSGKILQWS